jgi:thiamine monophosphate kinase
LEIAETGKITSTIDLNDGLEKCSREIAQINNIDVRIFRHKIPISPAAEEVARKLEMDSKELAFSFGGDLNIMMTYRPQHSEVIRKAVEKSDKKLFEIGAVSRGRGEVLVEYSNDTSEKPTYKNKIRKSSYEHFVTRPLYIDDFWKKVVF